MRHTVPAVWRMVHRCCLHNTRVQLATTRPPAAPQQQPCAALCAVLRCAALCCAVLRCAALRCAAPRCAVLHLPNSLPASLPHLQSPTTSGCWRRGWLIDGNSHINLCNKCGLRYKHGRLPNAPQPEVSWKLYGSCMVQAQAPAERVGLPQPFNPPHHSIQCDRLMQSIHPRIHPSMHPFIHASAGGRQRRRRRRRRWWRWWVHWFTID
jgi:hypothetical protein